MAGVHFHNEIVKEKEWMDMEGNQEGTQGGEVDLDAAIESSGKPPAVTKELTVVVRDVEVVRPAEVVEPAETIVVVTERPPTKVTQVMGSQGDAQQASPQTHTDDGEKRIASILEPYGLSIDEALSTYRLSDGLEAIKDPCDAGRRAAEFKNAASDLEKEIAAESSLFTPGSSNRLLAKHISLSLSMVLERIDMKNDLARAADEKKKLVAATAEVETKAKKAEDELRKAREDSAAAKMIADSVQRHGENARKAADMLKSATGRNGPMNEKSDTTTTTPATPATPAPRIVTFDFPPSPETVTPAVLSPSTSVEENEKAVIELEKQSVRRTKKDRLLRVGGAVAFLALVIVVIVFATMRNSNTERPTRHSPSTATTLIPPQPEPPAVTPPPATTPAQQTQTTTQATNQLAAGTRIGPYEVLCGTSASFIAREPTLHGTVETRCVVSYTRGDPRPDGCRRLCVGDDCYASCECGPAHPQPCTPP